MNPVTYQTITINIKQITDDMNLSEHSINDYLNELWNDLKYVQNTMKPWYTITVKFRIKILAAYYIPNC